MKAKIIEKKYYVAKLKDGREFSVDVSNPLIKRAIQNNELLDGQIIKDEIQNKYTDGTYSRSYSIVEEFVPYKNNNSEKKFKVDGFWDEPKKDRKIPYVPKEERSQLDEGKPEKIKLPDVDPNKVRLLNEGTEPKHIKLK